MHCVHLSSSAKSIGSLSEMTLSQSAAVKFAPFICPTVTALSSGGQNNKRFYHCLTLLTCLQDKRGSKVKTVPVTPNMDQTTSRPMPVATTLPAARDVQAMQQRRRLEGGANSSGNSLTVYLCMRFHSGSVCQDNIFS